MRVSELEAESIDRMKSDRKERSFTLFKEETRQMFIILDSFPQPSIKFPSIPFERYSTQPGPPKNLPLTPIRL